MVELPHFEKPEYPKRPKRSPMAEAYDLMKRVGGMTGDQMADVFSSWNSKEELSSYLVEITEICLRTKDPDDKTDPFKSKRVGEVMLSLVKIFYKNDRMSI